MFMRYVRIQFVLVGVSPGTLRAPVDPTLIEILAVLFGDLNVHHIHGIWPVKFPHVRVHIATFTEATIAARTRHLLLLRHMSGEEMT